MCEYYSSFHTCSLSPYLHPLCFFIFLPLSSLVMFALWLSSTSTPTSSPISECVYF